MANLEAVRDGKKGNDCRGEEHEVQFVCFVKSKKVRIYWNGRNITHLFREASRKEDQLAVAWQARSGEIFQVASGSNSSPQGKPQYDFFIDGRSFSSLPSVAELGAAAFGLARDERRSPVDECCAEKIEVCSLGYEVSEASSGVVPELEEGHGEEAIFEEAPAGQNFRLSMAGLTPSRPGDEVVDELRSDLYSSTIEVLRNQITECIPETEELVSRAVINAFFSGDDESRTSHDSISESFSEPFPGAIHFEVDSMSQAYEWLRLNRNHALRPDHKERKLEFLQKQVDAVMLEIRRERLSANEACQILFSVACVLGLVVNPVLENTAIVLVGLGKGAKDNDLHSELKWYGEISAAAVSEDGDIGRFWSVLLINNALNLILESS